MDILSRGSGVKQLHKIQASWVLDRYQDFHIYPCTCHGIDLLVKEIIKGPLLGALVIMAAHRQLCYQITVFS
jgi:hypothetical protein